MDRELLASIRNVQGQATDGTCEACPDKAHCLGTIKLPVLDRISSDSKDAYVASAASEAAKAVRAIL